MILQMLLQVLSSVFHLCFLFADVVGVSTQQPDFLKFLFELNEEFSVLPTFGVIPAFSALQSLLSGSVPGLSGINPARVRAKIFLFLS